MAISVNRAGAALKKIFQPKLVEHIPGQKRVYKNVLGTKTTYTLESVPLKVGNANTPVEHLRVVSWNGSGLPSDMYVNRSAYPFDINKDTPITDTCFSKVKSYLFGLIKGKSKTVETLNFDNRAVMRAQKANVTTSLKDSSKTVAHGQAGRFYDIEGPSIKLIG